uniref:Uncharacterized protein n=1 Tax=Anopheles christyi TaxID=43041 RepID=A0A182KHU9_9DIPT
MLSRKFVLPATGKSVTEAHLRVVVAAAAAASSWIGDLVGLLGRFAHRFVLGLGAVPHRVRDGKGRQRQEGER